MNDLIKALPDLPAWVTTPIIIFAIIGSLWPKVAQVIRELSAHNRYYEREKKRLELLKLKYEIEAIKKDKSLETIEEAITETGDEPLNSELVTLQKPAKALSFKFRFAYGALGGIIAPLIEFLKQPAGMIYNQDGVLWAAWAIGALIFALLGGLIAAFVHKEHASPPVCIITGLAVPLLLKALLSTPVQEVPITSEIDRALKLG